MGWNPHNCSPRSPKANCKGRRVSQPSSAGREDVGAEALHLLATCRELEGGDGGGCKIGVKETFLRQGTALQKEGWRSYEGLCVQNGVSRAEGWTVIRCSGAECVTAGTKREIESGYKDTREAGCDKTCCFSNGITTNKSHFAMLFCPGLLPAGF